MIKTLISLMLVTSVFANTQSNDIASRLQWMNNSGYCGEVALICAGLYYGQYVSQYDLRALVTDDQTQGSLLLGENDNLAAKKLHLQHEAWNTDDEQNTDQFLIWLKQKIVNGNPVAIGVYANQYLFYGTTDPKAGDPDYDHIVSVMNLTTNHPLDDPTYYGDDQVGFSDNGLWENQNTPVYYFIYAFDPFQATREEANDPSGPIYSISSEANNYGIAITGVADKNGDTLPVRVATDFNFENPEIVDQSTIRPQPMPLNLTITVSNVEPHVPYVIYRYNKLDAVPESDFNAHASQASEQHPFQIASGSTYAVTEMIQSDEIAVYRCVKASAP